eukprot:CAMPEP_0178435384 /NCGR_PEP_ID=MMETSP0689_2-20121128/33904_1 /TAXON_ID=160604 /ORGANISM="Amphidinium massartii, Strain CS-259" /LENGTH=658 /DNA_ID=CAMNT_0020057463 /DNA_START=97 /DNA_END=2073 /DNA_ORIENTATION=-
MKMMVALRVVVSISAFAGVKSDASFALMDSIQAACQKTSITQPMRASNLASTTQTVTRAHPMRVEAVPSWVPAVHSIGAEDISQRSMQKINKVRSQIGSTRYCADIAALVSDLREISSAHIASVEAMSLVDSSEVAEAGVISSEIARTFNELVIRWAELPWCPRAVKAITQSMQVVSEEWIQMYSGYGILSMDAARISSSTWAQAFTNVTNAWQEATARAKDCKDTTVMMGLLKDMVTSVSSSTQAWVGFFDKVHGQDEDEVEVMGEWLRPMQAALANTKENSMAWAQSCGAFEGSTARAKAAAEAVADFIQHFSRKALLTSQQWAQAFRSCAPDCWAAAEQASIMASSVIKMSDIAQVSHSWAMAFANNAAAVEETSEMWAQTFAQIVQDVEEEALAWSEAFRTSFGSHSAETATSASDSWASSFQLLSVATTVAVEGWTDKELLGAGAQQASASWIRSSALLLRGAGEAARRWADVLEASKLDDSTMDSVHASASTWASTFDATIDHLKEASRMASSCEASSEWAETYRLAMSGIQSGSSKWMQLVASKNATYMSEQAQVAFDAHMETTVSSSLASLDAGMQLACESSYAAWEQTANRALGVGEDLPFEWSLNDVSSPGFLQVLEESAKYAKISEPVTTASAELLGHICSHASTFC